MPEYEDRDTNGWGSVLRTRTAKESQEFHDTLARLFVEVEEWNELVSDPVQVHPDSVMGFADALSDPLQVSHAVGYLRLTAVDHLHALRTLMKEAQAQHIFAPYSLLRASIESSASALWVLSDSEPRSVAVRSLKLEWSNIRDRENAYATVQAPGKNLEEWKKTFDDLLSRNALRKEGIKANPPGALKILQAASKTFGLGTTPALMWQMCSGATHGRKWVTGFLTMMEAEDDGISKIIGGRLTSDEQAIVLATYVACDLVRRLLQVQALYSKPTGHTGNSFVKGSPKLLVPNHGLLLPQRFTR